MPTEPTQPSHKHVKDRHLHYLSHLHVLDQNGDNSSSITTTTSDNEHEDLWVLTSGGRCDSNKRNRIKDYVNDTLHEVHKINDVPPPASGPSHTTKHIHNHPCHQNETNDYKTHHGGHNYLEFKETGDNTDTEDEDPQSVHHGRLGGCEHIISPTQCTK